MTLHAVSHHVNDVGKPAAIANYWIALTSSLKTVLATSVKRKEAMNYKVSAVVSGVKWIAT